MFAINFILNAVRQWWELPFLTKYLAGVFSILGWLPASMTSLVIHTVFFTLPIHFSKLFSLKKNKKKKRVHATRLCHNFGPASIKLSNPSTKR